MAYVQSEPSSDNLAPYAVIYKGLPAAWIVKCEKWDKVHSARSTLSFGKRYRWFWFRKIVSEAEELKIVREWEGGMCIKKEEIE